jgi:cell division protein FtsL
MAMVQPKYVEERPRIRNPRSARNATQTRIVKNARARYGGIIRIVGGLGVVLALLMTYVMLLSNTTSLSYALDKAQHQRDALQEQTSRLDDQIAQMSSEERLAKIAAQLKMHEPDTYAVVQLRPPPVVASKFPVLDSIAAWFGGAPHTRVR